MSAVADKDAYIAHWAKTVNALLIDRNNLTKDELVDLVTRTEKLRDEKLKEYISRLVGWGDAERAEMLVFVQVALECMKEVRPSRVRAIAEGIEIKRRLLRMQIEKEQAP